MYQNDTCYRIVLDNIKVRETVMDVVNGTNQLIGLQSFIVTNIMIKGNNCFWEGENSWLNMYTICKSVIFAYEVSKKDYASEG